MNVSIQKNKFIKIYFQNKRNKFIKLLNYGGNSNEYFCPPSLLPFNKEAFLFVPITI